jgi:hypothetical protein
MLDVKVTQFLPGEMTHVRGVGVFVYTGINYIFISEYTIMMIISPNWRPNCCLVLCHQGVVEMIQNNLVKVN